MGLLNKSLPAFSKCPCEAVDVFHCKVGLPHKVVDLAILLLLIVLRPLILILESWRHRRPIERLRDEILGGLIVFIRYWHLVSLDVQLGNTYCNCLILVEIHALDVKSSIICLASQCNPAFA